jgi:hypothetical protein
MAQKEQAASQPQFIIKSADGTVYYLTVSLWIYEPGTPGSADPTAARQVKEKFDKLAADPANLLQAVRVPDLGHKAYTAMIT